jgi:hypothetical protein
VTSDLHRALEWVGISGLDLLVQLLSHSLAALRLHDEGVTLHVSRVLAGVGGSEVCVKVFNGWLSRIHVDFWLLLFTFRRITFIEASALDFFKKNCGGLLTGFLSLDDALLSDVGHCELDGCQLEPGEEGDQARTDVAPLLQEVVFGHPDVLFEGVVEVELSFGLRQHYPEAQNQLERWNGREEESDEVHNPLELEENNDNDPLHEVPVQSDVKILFKSVDLFLSDAGWSAECHGAFVAHVTDQI